METEGCSLSVPMSPKWSDGHSGSSAAASTAFKPNRSTATAFTCSSADSVCPAGPAGASPDDGDGDGGIDDVVADSPEDLRKRLLLRFRFCFWASAPNGDNRDSWSSSSSAGAAATEAAAAPGWMSTIRSYRNFCSFSGLRTWDPTLESLGGSVEGNQPLPPVRRVAHETGETNTQRSGELGGGGGGRKLPISPVLVMIPGGRCACRGTLPAAARGGGGRRWQAAAVGFGLLPAHAS